MHLYNYADDRKKNAKIQKKNKKKKRKKKTLSYSSPDLSQTKAVVEAESENTIQWFAFNNLQANPEKFRP